MNDPDTKSLVANGEPAELRTQQSSVTGIVSAVAVGFFYAMFCFALGFFGVGTVGLILALLAGSFVSAILGYYAGPNWPASALTQCAGTAPYTLLLLLGDGLSLGDRLVNLIFMIGPAVIGTPVGAQIRRRVVPPNSALQRTGES